jgi:small membrane protein
VIKVLLILGLLGFTALELRGRSSAGHLAVRRIVAILILGLGVTGIFFPGLVTDLAQLVGVGRGTDLVLYALVIAFLFSTLGLYQRLRKLEDRYVELSRRVAVDQALRIAEAADREPAPSAASESTRARLTEAERRRAAS